jgi:thioredoxin reductase
MSEKKVAIVGAGPAGVTAAVQLRRYGISPILFDSKGRAGGLIENANAVENFPLLPAGTPGLSIADLLRSRCIDLRIDVVDRAIERVTVEKDGRFALASGGGIMVEKGIHALLLAAGTKPVEIDGLEVGELEGRLVFYEIVELRNRVAPLKTAVIGSGDAAFDYALTLAMEPNAEIGIFMRSGRARCNPSLEAACRDNPRVEIVRDHGLSRALELDGGLSLLFETSSGPRELRADALLVAIGRRSNLPDLLPGIDMDRIAGSGATGIPGIFAAGDIRRGDARQLAIAMGDGAAAAMEIAAYIGEQCRNI